MYQYFIICLIFTVASAKPGNLAIGSSSTGYGTGLSFTGYGGQYGIAAGLGALPNTSPVLPASPVIPATPAFVATAVHAVPTATSSQSRLDIINPQPLVQQIVTSVPVNIPAGYLRYSVAEYGTGLGYGTGAGYAGYARSVATGLGVAHGNNGAIGHGGAGY